ncbi:MAG: LptF/LptG family permease [Burkholderiales bacterium]|nr:LptF/LptG family permease [Opitutaceae bacterium]
MGLLHRHLFASVAGACVAAVALFGFVLIAGMGLRDLLGYVMAGQLAPETALHLIALLLPYVAVYALPIGLLTAVLLVLGRMSSQQEITAMRAAGLSLGYVSRPIWVIAGAAVLLSLALNFYVMPQARTAYRATLVEAVRQNPLNFIVPRTFVRDFPGYVVYVGDRSGGDLNDFWLWELDSQKRVLSMSRAKSATVTFREEDSRLVLTLRDVSAETRDRVSPEDFTKPQPVGNSDSMTVELKLDGLFKQMKLTQKTNWMTLDQLLARRDALEAKGAKADAKETQELTRVKVVLSEKAAASFAVLAFAFVAVPLGIKVSRKETSANLGIAVALVLGYYFLAALTGMLERSPALRPELWVWAPPLAYAAAGVWLFRRVDRA